MMFNFNLDPDERYYKFYLHNEQIILSKIDDDIVTIRSTTDPIDTICHLEDYNAVLKTAMTHEESEYIILDMSTTESQLDMIKQHPELFIKVDRSSSGKTRFVRTDNDFLLDLRIKGQEDI